MTKKSSQALTGELFKKVAAIKLNDTAIFGGTSSRDFTLQALRKSVAELSAALGSKKMYDEIMQRYEEMVAAIDTAGITGLISETELGDYYKLVDQIWEAIEQENKA
jgi:hypothetical protein